MTVLPNWTTFRHRFSVEVNETAAFTYVNGTPSTITRASGSFVTQGYEVGHTLDVVDDGGINEGRYGELAGVAALTLTLATGDTLTNGTPIPTSTLRAAHIDPDGVNQWPVANVRAGSFAKPTGTPTPYAGTSFTVTANAGAADAAKGTHEYHWYLSQRTDVPASQYFTITQKASTASDSYSGSVDIVHTALATSTFGLATPPTPQQIVWLFRHVHLYCYRVSDGAIQWIDMLREMTANT